MRGRRGNDFKSAAFPQFAKSGKQIEFAFIDKEAPGFAKDFEIKVRELAELRVIAVPFSFTRREINQKIEMPYVTLAKQLVPQHCAERRRERHGKLKRHMLIDQAPHHAHQRHITLRYCFEEPVLFQKMFIFRVANERQVRVKNEREVSRHGATLNVSFRA